MSIKEKILCPKCKGRKTVADKVEAVFTLGMSLLFKFDKDDGREKCSTCNGKGKITL